MQSRPMQKRIQSLNASHANGSSLEFTAYNAEKAPNTLRPMAKSNGALNELKVSTDVDLGVPQS